MVGLIAAALRLSAALGFAALGETISQRAGMLNISLEGMILGSAFASVIGSAATGSALLGVLSGMAAGATVAYVQAVFSLRLKADQIIVGLALNLAVLGLTTFAFRGLYHSSISNVAGLVRIDIPVVHSIPLLGEAVFSQDILFYLLLFVAAPLAWWLLWRTAWGLNVRACGDNPWAADAAGVRVERTRLQAVLLCGAFAGVAGAELAIGQLRGFSEGMSAGRGFLCIAAVIFGRWQIGGTLAACLVFGTGQALQFQLPALGYSVPPQLLVAIPYLLALMAVVLLGGGRGAPAALMRTFERRPAR